MAECGLEPRKPARKGAERRGPQRASEQMPNDEINDEVPEHIRRLRVEIKRLYAERDKYVQKHIALSAKDGRFSGDLWAKKKVTHIDLKDWLEDAEATDWEHVKLPSGEWPDVVEDIDHKAFTEGFYGAAKAAFDQVETG